MKKNNLNITGIDYWRSLGQLSDTPQFQKFLHNEFPTDSRIINMDYGSNKACSSLKGDR